MRLLLDQGGQRPHPAAAVGQAPADRRDRAGGLGHVVTQHGPVLVVSAHAGDFVWRAGGAIALAASRGAAVTVLCLSYGERGESARAWRDGKKLDEIKALRRDEAGTAAGLLRAGGGVPGAGDHPPPRPPGAGAGVLRRLPRVDPAGGRAPPPRGPPP